MGTFRTVQNELLTSTEQELVDYNVYDKDGTFKRTEEKDVLIISPNQMIPLDRSMTVEYLRPLNKVELSSKLDSRNIVNNNPSFNYGAYRMNQGDGSIVTKTTVLGDTSFTSPRPPLTGERCWQSGGSVHKAHDSIVTSDIQLVIATLEDNCLVNNNNDFEVGFSYYISNTQSYDYAIPVTITITDDSSNVYRYNFDTNSFSSAGASLTLDHVHLIKGSKIDQWQNFSKKIEAHPVNNQKLNKIRFSVMKPIYNLSDGNTNHNQMLVDNIFVSNTLDYGSEVLTIRERNDDNFTGIYEQKGRLISEELDDTLYDNAIDLGVKSRLRDTTVVSKMEELVTQEILNDYREYVKRYEGKFHNGNLDPIPVALHNKIWFKFNDLTEDVTAYIDSMTYNIKRNEYDLVTHIPNQDDDLTSTYQVTFE